MISISNQVQIGISKSNLFDLASEIENYPKFAPNYLHSQIVDFKRGDPIVERTAVINGQIQKWKSRAHFSPYEQILFEQLEGPLKGMQAIWTFQSISLKQTSLSIVHQIEAEQNSIEKIKNVFENILVGTTQDFLEGFKKWSESLEGESQ